MKLKFFIIVLFSVFCMSGYAQKEDHLDKIKKPKEEKDKDEQKLNTKGKAEHEKAKKERAELQNATFELTANEVENQDPSELLGIPANEKPDKKLADDQNEDNKKKQGEIKAKIKKDAKSDKADVDFSATGAPPAAGVGASWTDASFWNPAYYTPVKNQANCGSCWAFAAAATFEHTYAKFWGTKLDLSEQDIVACGRTCANVDCGSCNGGWSDRAFDFIKCKGVANEATYPYNIPASNTCLAKPKFKTAYTWGQLLVGGGFPSKEWVKYYITMYGSVVSYMKAGLSTFYAYGYGVYNGYPSNATNNVDHAVTIVGWSDPNNAWIIKNSWGTGWGGYGGYAYVGYNQCNLAKYVYWVYPNY